ncbi:acyltransferase family protein [Rhizobium mongolense]
MKYRTEIEGLRAVAVLSVIVFHAYPNALPGGFIGVDIFFVISGYLITSIILRDIEAGTFSIARFFEKRARRILPALFFVIACCVPAGWYWMMPAELRAFSDSVIAACLSVSNIFFWTKSGYFAPETAQMPLLHTWSLGVEEQFYAIYPFLLRRIGKKSYKKNATLLFLVAGATLSIIVSYICSKYDPELNFYFLPTRAWEFFFGGACAVFSGGRERDHGWWACAGIILIGAAVICFDESSQFPAASLAVAGTCLVLTFARSGNFVGNSLSLPPLVMVGTISYSAYLWHQPLFAFAKIRSVDVPNGMTMFALIVVSLALAYCTYRFIERPFRRKPDQEIHVSKGFVGGCAVFTIALVSFGIYGNLTKGAPSRLPPQISNFIQENAWNRRCLAFTDPSPLQLPEPSCVYNSEHDSSYAIVGDSIASSLSPSLAAQLDRHGIALEQMTHTACAPIVEIKSSGEPAQGCPNYIQTAFERIKASGVKTVILAGAWITFFDEKNLVRNKQPITLTSSKGKAMVREALQSTVNELLEAGIRVVLLYPVPRGDSQVVAKVAKLMLTGNLKPTVSVSKEKYFSQAKDAVDYLDSIKGGNIIRVFPSQSFCNTADNNCVLASGGQAYIYDKLHLTRAGADVVAKNIVGALIN